MTRGATGGAAIVLGALALGAGIPLRAQAHGGAGQALSIAALVGDEVEVVQLDEGLALRRPEGYRFVCPIQWGQESTAPAASVPGGGPVVIGGLGGLFVMSGDGAIEPHPDPEAGRGQVLALARAERGLFGLRNRDGRVELVQIEADVVRVVWSGDEGYQDLAAGSDYLALVRVEGLRVHALRLSLSGEVLGAAEALLSEPASVAWARPLGDELGIVVVFASLDSELGAIEDGGWRSLRRGASLAGPIELADGTRLIGIDGTLYALEETMLQTLEGVTGAECLRQFGELDYACRGGDLHALSGRTVGPVLFSLAELVEPDLELVAEELRQECELQWQRYVLLELGMRGIAPRELDTDAAADAGVRDGGSSDGGETPACGCRAAGRPRRLPAWAWLVLAAAPLALRRRSPHATR